MRRRLIPASLVILTLASAAAGAMWYVRSTRPDARLERGRAALQSDDIASAQLYAEQLDAAGAADHARVLEAEVALKLSDPAEAFTQLKRVDPAGPLRIQAAFLGAQSLMAMRRPSEAEPMLALVLTEEPDHAEAHRWAGILFHDQGDFPRAVEHLKRTAELLPHDGRALRLVALIFKDLENHRDAVPAYRESLRRDPNPRDAGKVRIELAESLRALLLPAEALDALGDVKSAAADAVRAEAFVALGREGEAIAVLDAALALTPDYSDLLTLRAERHRAANELDAAARLFERVLKLDPHHLKCRHLLAQVCEARGQSGEALEHLTKMKATEAIMEELQRKNRAAMNDPWNAKVRMELASLCERLGRMEMAAMWRRAAAACPSRP